ncbi:hypothetical protein DFH29DRAFT_588287 [Suillus ampliporus]|nr:hypothetical protein DFH29DRAFT_588287 [Suillus ampliporus]
MPERKRIQGGRRQNLSFLPPLYKYIHPALHHPPLPLLPPLFPPHPPTLQSQHPPVQNTPRGSPSASRIRTSRITCILSIDNNLATSQPPTSFALIRSYFKHYFTANRIATLAVLFFLIAFLSLIVRRCRHVETPADQVRRKLLQMCGDSIVRRSLTSC